MKLELSKPASCNLIANRCCTNWIVLLSSLQIMRNAADTLIPVTLELGGKDAFVVCEDVDVPHV